MTWRTIPLLLVAWPSLAAPSLSCQVPYGYLVVVEELPSGASCMRLVDPAGGPATELRHPGGAAAEARAVAVDPRQSTRLLILAEGVAGSFELRGSQVVDSHADPLIAGSPARLHGDGLEVFVSVPHGSQAGLWSVAPGEQVLVGRLSGARDIAVIGGTVYVNTHGPAASSRIDAITPSTGGTRTLGTAYPPIVSLGEIGDRLLAGTESGELLAIDRFSGAAASLGNPRLGAVAAIATDPVTGVPYLGTADAVYRFGSFSSPVYVSSGTILDLDVGIHDLASLLFYGDGCAGSGSLVPGFDHVDLPALGTDFTLALTRAPPLTGAFLVAGFSRESLAGTWSLPVRLDTFVPDVSPECLVLTDVQVNWFLTTDAAGRGSVRFAVPGLPQLLGVRSSWQWVVLDPGAEGGITTSHGAEAIAR